MATRNVVIVQQIVPGYRLPFFRSLAMDGKLALTMCSGDLIDPFTGDGPTWRRRRVLGGARIQIQQIPIREIWNTDVVVVELNPRNLGAWLTALLARLLRREVVLWGHREGRDGTRRPLIRRAMESIGNQILYYTPAEVQRSIARRDRRRSRKPKSINNTIEVVYRPSTRRTDLVFSARLVPEKDPLLGVRAVAAMREPRPALHVIGSGPLHHDVLNAARRYGIQVRMHGEQYDPHVIAHVYERCVAALSPGYVGLSINQALLSGVPLVYRSDANHAPEISYADQWNSRGVAGADPQRWAAELNRICAGDDELSGRNEEIERRARAELGLATMVRNMIIAVGAAENPACESTTPGL